MGKLILINVHPVFFSAIESESTSRSSSKNKQIRPEDYSGYDSVSRVHHSDLKHREWFVFDNALVLPEYIVEYELVTKGHLQAESHGLQYVLCERRSDA